MPSDAVAEIRRRQNLNLTPEQIAARQIVAHARAIEFMTNIADQRCVVCGREGVTFEQVYRCVYTRECGHRQYQGKVP